MVTAGERIGDYVVESEVGGGGFATVYRVRSTRDGQLYAMKVLDPEHRKHTERRMRFLDEARIQARRLDHPNIVKVVEILATDDVAALVLEYVPGGDLEDWIRARDGVPSAAEVRDIALPLLDAVGHAHSHGVIHRDLKPANILIAEIDGRPVPKVTDFGVAKVLSDSAKKRQTATRAQIGTLGYMSPEQIKSPKNVTVRSDIFSLGAVLYELATGVEPFGGGSDYEVMDNVVNARYRRATSAAHRLPQSMAAAIDRALSASPAERFAGCDELAAALASGEVARAPAPRSGPLIPRWVRVAGAVGVAVALWGMFRLSARSARSDRPVSRERAELALPDNCTLDGTWTLRFRDAPAARCSLPTPYEVQFTLRERGGAVTVTADPFEMFGNLAALGGDLDGHVAADSCTVFATTELRGEQIHFSVTERMGMLSGWARQGTWAGKLDSGECTIGGTRKAGAAISARAPAPPPGAASRGDEPPSLDFISLAVGVDECDAFFQRTVACMGRRDELTAAARRALIERVERTRRDIDAANTESRSAVCLQAIREARHALATPCVR